MKSIALLWEKYRMWGNKKRMAEASALVACRLEELLNYAVEEGYKVLLGSNTIYRHGSRISFNLPHVTVLLTGSDEHVVNSRHFTIYGHGIDSMYIDVNGLIHNLMHNPTVGANDISDLRDSLATVPEHIDPSAIIDQARSVGHLYIDDYRIAIDEDDVITVSHEVNDGCVITIANVAGVQLVNGVIKSHLSVGKHKWLVPELEPDMALS